MNLNSVAGTLTDLLNTNTGVATGIRTGGYSLLIPLPSRAPHVVLMPVKGGA